MVYSARASLIDSFGDGFYRCWDIQLIIGRDFHYLRLFRYSSDSADLGRSID
jgi:hypothetical protein